jgi:hypothetical protein
VRMNSPRDSSRVKPWTPWPVESTRLHEEPYLRGSASVTEYWEWESADSHGVAGSDHVLARTEDVLDPALRTILLIASQTEHNEQE